MKCRFDNEEKNLIKISTCFLLVGRRLWAGCSLGRPARGASWPCKRSKTPGHRRRTGPAGGELEDLLPLAGTQPGRSKKGTTSGKDPAAPLKKTSANVMDGCMDGYLEIPAELTLICNFVLLSVKCFFNYSTEYHFWLRCFTDQFACVLFLFYPFDYEFIAWCTCLCILSFLPLACLPRTQSTHSTCTLGSVWQIWNGYSNCSAWLYWNINEEGWLLFIQTASTALSEEFWLIYRPPVYVLSLVRTHLCIYSWKTDLHVQRTVAVLLCRWRTCRASTLESDSTPWLPVVTSNLCLYYWLACRHWYGEAKQHRPPFILPALISEPFIGRQIF